MASFFDLFTSALRSGQTCQLSFLRHGWVKPDRLADPDRVSDPADTLYGLHLKPAISIRLAAPSVSSSGRRTAGVLLLQSFTA